MNVNECIFGLCCCHRTFFPFSPFRIENENRGRRIRKGNEKKRKENSEFHMIKMIMVNGSSRKRNHNFC